MNKRKHPKAAANRQGAKCDSTRTQHDSHPGCLCNRCLALTLAADVRRREIVASLMTIDPTLTTAAMMYAAGGMS